MTEHTGMGSIRTAGSVQPYATLTPMTEEEIMTAYRDRLNAGEYQGDGPEHEQSPTLEPEQTGDQPSYQDSDEELRATQAAQAKADELGVDIATVQGSGKDGRVTVADVEAAAGSE